MKATYVESLPGRDKSILGTALHGTKPVSQKGEGEGERRIWSGGVLKGAFPPSH